VKAAGYDHHEAIPVPTVVEEEWLEVEVLYGFRMWHIIFLSSAAVMGFGKFHFRWLPSPTLSPQEKVELPSPRSPIIIVIFSNTPLLLFQIPNSKDKTGN